MNKKMEIILIEKEIEKVHFKLTVDPTIPDNKLGGCPTLFINDEAHLIYPVDTLTVIKAIATSKNLIYLKKGVENHWCSDKINETCSRIEKEMGYV